MTTKDIMIIYLDKECIPNGEVSFTRNLKKIRRNNIKVNKQPVITRKIRDFKIR